MSIEYTIDIQLRELGYPDILQPTYREAPRRASSPGDSLSPGHVPDTHVRRLLLAGKEAGAAKPPSHVEPTTAAPVAPRPGSGAAQSPAERAPAGEKAVKSPSEARAAAAASPPPANVSVRDDVTERAASREMPDLEDYSDDSEVSDLFEEEEVDEEKEDDDDDEEEEEEDEEEGLYNELSHSGDYRCGVCDVQLPSKFKLQDHMNLHTGARPYLCAECGKRFSQIHSYRGNTLFTCYVCDRSFLSSEELTQHQPTHSKDDKPFKCVHCKESFKTFSELTAHRRQVCPEKQMVCKDCNETFRSAGLLRNHRLTQHLRPDVDTAEQPEDSKTHRCKKCGQGFETEPELIEHQEKYPEGQQCNGSASSVKKRGRPAKVEDSAAAEKKGKRKKKDEAEAPEVVVKASSASESTAPLEEKAKATGAKRGRPSKAAVAAAAAAAAAAVKSETEDTKSPEDDSQAPAMEKKPKADAAPAARQHPCPECDLTFPALIQLRAHKKVKHAPRKAHPCEECEESFARPEQLEAHMSRSHAVGRLACPTCGKSFGRERTLKAHQKIHPEEKPENPSAKR